MSIHAHPLKLEIHGRCSNVTCIAADEDMLVTSRRRTSSAAPRSLQALALCPPWNASNLGGRGGRRIVVGLIREAKGPLHLSHRFIPNFAIMVGSPCEGWPQEPGAVICRAESCHRQDVAAICWRRRCSKPVLYIHKGRCRVLACPCARQGPGRAANQAPLSPRHPFAKTRVPNFGSREVALTSCLRKGRRCTLPLLSCALVSPSSSSSSTSANSDHDPFQLSSTPPTHRPRSEPFPTTLPCQLLSSSNTCGLTAQFPPTSTRTTSLPRL
nr:hypothetical protein CFP56_70641 [Quercus suber]